MLSGFIIEHQFIFSPGPPDHELTTAQLHILKDALQKVKDTVQRLAADHRDLHSTVSKVGKTIDRVS